MVFESQQGKTSICTHQSASPPHPTNLSQYTRGRNHHHHHHHHLTHPPQSVRSRLNISPTSIIIPHLIQRSIAHTLHYILPTSSAALSPICFANPSTSSTFNIIHQLLLFCVIVIAPSLRQPKPHPRSLLPLPFTIIHFRIP